MPVTPRIHQAGSLLLVAALAALSSAIVAVGAWSDQAGRSAGPELPVAAYAAAVGREDLQGALEQLAPELREVATSFVAWELGNRYTILASVVRTEPLLDRLLSGSDGQPRVVVIMEIETVGQPPWRATEELPVRQRDGRWYLLKVPLY